MEQRGAIWDMDGVLVDTGELHYQTWSEALTDYGISLSREQFEATFGMNNRGVLTTILGHEPAPEFLEDVSDRKEAHFRRLIHQKGVNALPGVMAWLHRLQAAGYRQAIASSAPPPNIDAVVDALQVRDCFQAIISGSDLRSKPDPATFLKASNELDLEPACCVVVEDAIAGVDAAQRAGMACIAVTTTNPADRLEHADIVVNRLDQLAPDTFDRLLAHAVR
jgi:beta-phosphoglucomutase family hydrolase